MAGLDFWETLGETNTDIERSYSMILERGAPVSSHELTAQVIETRVREEERRIAEAAARGAPLYQPKQTYTAGQHLIFSALDDREGVVTGVRPGDNPRVGEFQVIAVQFDDQVREFAMAYDAEHPLNVDRAPLLDSILNPEAAIAQHGEAVRARLMQRLGNDKEFIKIDDGWFLRGLLPEIHEGHLNLAEAAIEQAGDAQSTAELLKVLDLKKATAAFALNIALTKDSRFDDVGPTNQPRWYLTRMEMPEARERPTILDSAPARAINLPEDLESVATMLFDGADLNGDVTNRTITPRDEITLVLTWPHRRAGTLPITPFVRAMLPAFTRPRLKITLTDAATHDKIAAFAINDGNYIAGLSNWFTARKLAPGAFITLRRGSDPFSMQIEYQAQRERSLWVRVARGVNGKLTFAQEKRPLAHKYDEDMLIFVNDPNSIEVAAQNARDQRLSILLEEIFPELAKLSGAGRVHAKTLYSAVNLVRRAGPRVVLGALVESRTLSSVGGGYFVLNDEARRV
jgi:hypothetical protein